MRALRFVGIGVGILVALLIVLLVSIKLFVHPNDYRGRIEQAVLHATGRQLQLTGDLRLSVFPWVALELGPASLGNPAGFGTEPFATLAHVAFRVKLLPLIAKRLEIGRIEIDNLDLRLQKNAAGKGNWENFGSSEGQPASMPAASAGRSNASSDAGMLREVDGVIVKDGRFSYQDAVADHIDLTTGSFASGTAMPVELAVTLHPKGGAAAVTWRFSSPGINLDLGAQTLDVPSFSTQLDKAQMSGSLHGKRVIDAPNVSGTFRLERVSPRDLMATLGISPPPTRDPKVLTTFSASGEFAYADNAARATALDVHLDESHLQGQAAITNLDTDAMDFDLDLDQIDVDRYLPPPPPPGAKPAPAAATSAAKGGAGAGFKKLQMKGSFTIGNLIVANLHLNQVKVAMEASEGVMHIAPMTATLYDGGFSGDITLTQDSTLGIKLQQTLNNVDIAKLLKDLAGTERLSGHGNINTDLTAHGWDEPAILRTLNGHVAANLSNGAVEGMDLWFEINRALALIQKQPMPSGNSSGRTKFDAFRASADINQGVATTKDLVISSQNLHIAGQGSSNLTTDQINYQVTATVLKDLPSAAQGSGAKLADIPLTITGTMSSPQVRPDLEGMAKARLQQELNNHQDQIKQKVQDTLKGLFK